MRDLLLWGSAVLFLFAALYTVAVRREVYALGREIGVLKAGLCESCCREDNLALLKERLRSPLPLLQRARRAGVKLAESSRVLQR